MPHILSFAKASQAFTFFLISFFALPILLFSQSDTLLFQQIEPIEITVSRIEGEDLKIPMSLSIIKKAQFDYGQPLIAADEILNFSPGVFALNPTNFAQDLRVSIRGFGARAAFGIRGIKLLVDGLPETTPDGQSQVDNLDLGVVDQFEIIKGPASGLYGNASGGVINITTEEALDKLFLESRLLVGSYGLQQYQLKAGQRTGKFNYLVHGMHTKLDGYRAHSEVENNLFNGKFQYDLGNNSKLQLILNYVNSPQANDPGGINLEAVDTDRRQARDRNVLFSGGEEVNQTKIGLVYVGNFGGKHQLNARVYQVWREFGNRLPFEFGGIVAIDRSFNGLGFTYRFNTDLGNLNYILKVGMDLENQTDDRTRFRNLEGTRGAETFNQEESFSSLGAYILQEGQLDNFRFYAGLRYDDLRLEALDRFLSDGDDSGAIDLDNFNPMLGLSYNISDAFNIYANYSTSFETPTLSELSNNPDGGGGFNPDLEPQKAKNYELGIKGKSGKRLKYSLAIFHIDLEDELIPFELDLFPGRTFFRNAGKSSRTGVEVETNWLLAKGLIGQLAYTYSDFTFGESTLGDLGGNQIPGLPKHLLSGSLRYLNLGGFYSVLQARHVGEIFLNDNNSQTDNAYTIVNLRFGYRFKFDGWNMEPFFGINNLLDTEYNSNIRINAFGGRFFEPGPEINIFGGVKVRLWK